MPVAVDMDDAGLAAEVARFVESRLGWQVVQDSADLPARVTLVDRPVRRAGAVLVVRDVTGDLLGDALSVGLHRVVRWPDEADRLAEMVPRTRPLAAGRRLLIGGTAGGVGTSTVALAVAAVWAHQGRTTWLVADERARALAGIDVADHAVVECSAVPGLRVASRVADVAPRLDAEDLVVVDVGTALGVDLLVARPDRWLANAIASGYRGPVVTVGEGALRPHELDRLLNGRGVAHLPWSSRIARAGLLGRLPGAFRRSTLDRVDRLVGPGRATRGAA